jgi:DNA polymerase III epsilon subunit-like protein
MNPLIPFTHRDVVFVDLETSGTDPSVHEIVEIAAIRLTADLQTEKARLEKKITMRHPERAEAKALQVNGYTPQEWRHAVPVRVACVDFAAMVDDDCIWVGHHPQFDEIFLRAAYLAEGLILPSFKTTIDTISIAWPLVLAGYLERVQLESMCTKYGISNAGAHRALADVQRTVRLYAKLLGRKEPQFGSLGPYAIPPANAAAAVAPADTVDPFALPEPGTDIPEWAQ